MLQVKPYGYIYKTTNLINQKIYIGQHTFSEFDFKYKGSGILLAKAFRKYKWENFKVEVVVWTRNKREQNELEIFYIMYYRKLYGKKMFITLQMGGRGLVWEKIMWQNALK